MLVPLYHTKNINYERMLDDEGGVRTWTRVLKPSRVENAGDQICDCECPHHKLSSYFEK